MARALFCFSWVNEGVAIMATPVTRKRQPLYMRQMMERLGLSRGAAQ